MRLFALRGAATVDANEADQILDATEALMREIMARNDLRPADVVSCIFTLTPDLDAEFPAVAARRLGFDRVPLLCAREVPVPGAMPRVIRALIHFYADEDHEVAPRLPRRGAEPARRPRVGTMSAMAHRVLRARSAASRPIPSRRGYALPDDVALHGLQRVARTRRCPRWSTRSRARSARSTATPTRPTPACGAP